MLALPAMLLIVGIAVLAFTEGWPVLTCAYVITQIVTTIGYGELHTKTTASKIFLALFAMAMLFVAAYTIGVFSDILLKRQSDVIRKYLRRLDSASVAFSNDAEVKLLKAMASCMVFVISGTFMFHILEDCTCGVEGLSGCRDPDYDTCVATGGYVKGFSDSFFMSVMTLTTIGFGDYQPRTVWGRLISIPWMLCGVAVFASSISTISAFFYDRKKAEALTAVDSASFKSQAAFKSIDRDGKGHLDRTDFLAYTLLKYDVVSEELVEAIFKEYENLEGAKAGRVCHATIAERQSCSFSMAPKQKDAPGV